MLTNVEEYVHVSSADRDTSLYPSVYDFTIPLAKTFREVRRVDLVRANMYLGSVTSPELFLTVKELPGNFEASDATVGDAHGVFSWAPGGAYLVEQERDGISSKFMAAEALPGLTQLSVRLHTRAGAPPTGAVPADVTSTDEAKQCHLTFRITTVVRRMDDADVRFRL
jgi:hypothetical protein